MLQRISLIYKNGLQDRLYEMRTAHRFHTIVFCDYTQPILYSKEIGSRLNIQTMQVQTEEYVRKTYVDFHDKKRKKQFLKWFKDHNGSDYCGVNLCKETRETPEYKYLVNNVVWIYRHFLNSKMNKLINSYQINFKII